MVQPIGMGIRIEDTFAKASFISLVSDAKKPQTSHVAVPFLGLVSFSPQSLPEAVRVKQFLDWKPCPLDALIVAHALGSCLGLVIFEQDTSLVSRLKQERQVAHLEADVPHSSDPNSSPCLVLASNGSHCLLYALKSPTHGRDLFASSRLGLVLGLEHTVLRYYDLEHRRPPKEEERNFLSSFDRTGSVVLPDGRTVGPVREQAQQPVVRLQSPEGTVIFTKVDGRSYMVHIRPGWEAFRDMLKATNHPNGLEVAPFRLHPVFKETEGNLAMELWRILDPDRTLLASDDIAQRVVMNHKSLDMHNAIAQAGCPMDDADFSIGVDNSSRWSMYEVVFPVRPYDPHVQSNVDSSLFMAMYAVENLRKDFWDGLDRLRRDMDKWTQSWVSSPAQLFHKMTPPNPPSVYALISKLKFRWLQDSQVPQHMQIPAPLAISKDFCVPDMRNKHHIIVDASALLAAEADRFDLFNRLEHLHGRDVLLLVSCDVMTQLESSSRDDRRNGQARACTDFVRTLIDSKPQYMCLQSRAEADLPPLSNPPRPVLDSAWRRLYVGVKCLVLAADENVLREAFAQNLPAIGFHSLRKLLSDHRLSRTSPDTWVEHASRLEHHHNKRVRN